MGGLGGGAFRKSILLSLINKSSRFHIDVCYVKRIDVDENLVEPGVFAPHVIFKQSSVTEKRRKENYFFVPP